MTDPRFHPGERGARRYREQVEDAFLRASAGDDVVGVQAYTRRALARHPRLSLSWLGVIAQASAVPAADPM